MKISTRLTLALAAVGFLLFSAYALHMIRQERQDLTSSVEREMWLVGRSLQVAVQNALRDRQLEDVQTTIEELHVIDPTVDIRVYDVRSNLIAASQHAAGALRPLDERWPQAQEETDERDLKETLRFEPADDPFRLVMTLPLLLDDGQHVGKLVVNRPLTDMREDLDATTRAIALSILGFVALTVLIGWILGNIYITRPLHAFVQAMKRVRIGDLSMPELTRAGGQELKEMSYEFGEMVSALAQAQRRIEQEAEERRRVLLGLQDADKLISIGQLSAGLAHEIGSPLQVLVGRARMLTARAEDAEEVRRNADILVDQGERIARIVDQLLQFGRRQPMELSEVEPAQTVQTVLDLLEFEARRKDVELRFDARGAPPRIEADAGQVQQIVFNLLTNALAAAPGGSQITVSLELADEMLNLEVCDRGPGIPPEIQGELFEPFFTTRSGEGGAGLGLAIVRALVQEHSGSVEYLAREGGGSRFVVRLPLVQAI